MSIQNKDFVKTAAGQPVNVGILENDTIEVHILSYGSPGSLFPCRKAGPH